MRKLFPVLLVLGICMAASAAWAQTVYVNPITKITLRTGPGTGNKIVAMLASGTRLTVKEKGSDWTQVEMGNGKTGWVLSRFLTTQVPVTLLVDRYKSENQRLASALEQSRTRTRELSQANAELSEIEKKYRKLRKEAAEVLKLKKDYQVLMARSQAQQEEIRVLEDNAGSEKVLWFLSGAGVFIVGLILGLSTRKKRRYSLLD